MQKRRRPSAAPTQSVEALILLTGAAGSQGWMFESWIQNVLKFSPLSFADHALEGAFADSQLAHGLSLAIAYFATLSTLVVLAIFVASPGSSEEWTFAWVFIAQSLLASICIYKFPTIASKYIQVRWGNSSSSNTSSFT